MSDAATPPDSTIKPKWCVLPAIERRVLGVLIEKAKTVPESYPMTINGIVVGANQKSNRYPLLNIEADAVEQALVHLRQVGAVTEVWGTGRGAKYRHHFYEWMGVEKAEAAVMTELLLRGAQTVGELRTRASRMEPIADLAAMRPVLQALSNKQLIISITPEGRGQVVAHNLYEPRELEKVKRTFEAIDGAELTGDEADDEATASDEPQPRTKPWQIEIDALRAEVSALSDEVQRLRQALGET